MSRKRKATSSNRSSTPPGRWASWKLISVLLVIGVAIWAWAPWETPAPQRKSMQMDTRVGGGQALDSTNPFSADSSVIARGQKIFTANCAVCHGQNAVGEDASSPMGGEKPDGDWLAPALNGYGHGWHHRPHELAGMIKYGSPRPGSRMQGWEGRLSDEDVNSILAYLFSIWPEQIQARYRNRPHH